MTDQPPSKRFWLTVLGVVLVLAFVNRLCMSINGYLSTFDTGTPGLMAVNILQGERPLFFYGQHYMGAIESYFAAFLFSIFGISETVKTLSTILFSLAWIGATYALFTECTNRKVGVASALVLAYPGWQILWYNIGTYGGYPQAFLFGTLVLWLAIRLLKRSIVGKPLFFYLPLIGLFAGLGLWTNYICGAFLGLAFILLVIHKWRVVGFRRGNAPYILAVLPFAIAILPLLDVILHGKSGSVASFKFEDSFIESNIELMTSNLLPELFFWPQTKSDFARSALPWLLWSGLITTLLAFWKPVAGVSRKWMWIPVYFVLLYLCLYLPHSMATVRASRYLIPGYAVFTCMVFGYGLCCRIPLVRAVGTACLIYWTAYNAFGSLHMMKVRQPGTIEKTSARMAVIETCERHNVSDVAMVGGFVFGHMGQVYSFLSKGNIAFGSVFDERHPETSQRLEAPDTFAFLSEQGNQIKVRQTLKALDIPFEWEELPRTSLIYGITAKPKSNRLIPSDEMTMIELKSGESVHDVLTDRRLTTAAEGKFGNGEALLIDFGRERMINQFWLMGADPRQRQLPMQFDIEFSLDGENFERMHELRSKRVPVGYTQGRGVYFLGYHGVSETRFPDKRARYMRILLRRGEHPRAGYKISELYVFESAETPTGTLEDDISSMTEIVEQESLTFLAANRWISGMLHKEEGLADRVFPRFNPKFRDTWITHAVSAKQGIGLVVQRSLADETEHILQEWGGEGVVRKRVDLNYYSIFLLNDAELPPRFDGENLYFSGHSLVARRMDENKELEFRSW